MRKTSAYGRRIARQTAWQRTRHEDINPVTAAVVRQKIEADIQRLRTDTGLQAYIGGDAARTTNMAGRLVYMARHAAGYHGLGDTPEARILAGTANALADLAQDPDSLERQRATIIAGLAAIDRLMPRLSTLALAYAGQQLDLLLAQTGGMGTNDVRKALGMAA